jgi:uncharacterized membrane protein YwzB
MIMEFQTLFFRKDKVIRVMHIILTIKIVTGNLVANFKCERLNLTSIMNEHNILDI